MTSWLINNYLEATGDFADLSEPSAVLAETCFLNEVDFAFPPVFSKSPDIFCSVGAGLPFSSADPLAILSPPFGILVPASFTGDFAPLSEWSAVSALTGFLYSFTVSFASLLSISTSGVGSKDSSLSMSPMSSASSFLPIIASNSAFNSSKASSRSTTLSSISSSPLSSASSAGISSPLSASISPSSSADMSLTNSSVASPPTSSIDSSSVVSDSVASSSSSTTSSTCSSLDSSEVSSTLSSSLDSSAVSSTLSSLDSSVSLTSSSFDSSLASAVTSSSARFS